MAQRLKGFPFAAERLELKSEGRWISAVHVRAGENAPTFLICHGIGERVEYWSDGSESMSRPLLPSPLSFPIEANLHSENGRGELSYIQLMFRRVIWALLP
jgi:hypothetical protein